MPEARGNIFSRIIDNVFLDTIIPGVSGIPFTFNVKTDNAGTSNNDQFTFPLPATADVNCYVDWDDGTNIQHITSVTAPEWTHTFTTGAGTYTPKIWGVLDNAIKFNNGGDKSKMTLISKWGSLTFSSDATGAFYGCNKLSITATDILDTVGCNLFLAMF